MKKREVQWERMFPDELEAAMEECPVAYLPYGLCEPHGPVNALGLDAIRAHGTLVQAARDFGGIVAPPEYWHCHESGGFGSWGHKNIGNARTWLTAVPPWVFFRNLCYHIRAVDALGFKVAILFSGHSGPHRLDVPIVLEIMQSHISTRIHWLNALGTNQPRFGDDKGMGGHAGRGETSLLWAVAPDCVDLSRFSDPEEPGPHFAMGDFVDISDRRAGEQMVKDTAAQIGERASELISEYDRLKPNHVRLTYDQIEKIWEEEIRPKLKDFDSMQEGDETPAEDSQWLANFPISERGKRA